MFGLIFRQIRRFKLFPSTKQWKGWKLPSKLTAIGAYIGMLAILLAILIPVLLRVLGTKEEPARLQLTEMTEPSSQDPFGIKVKMADFASRLLSGPDGEDAFGSRIEFILSNTGGSTIVVNRLYVEILEASPYKTYTFPIGARAPINTYKYAVKISSEDNFVPITDEIFKYGKDDIDAFELRITKVWTILVDQTSYIVYHLVCTLTHS